ncbi:hypothetical protein J6590_081418 [Homalodisca vitripennis]|nr:hypothetical protein J6590_081418 [Homalodisca vitripennis]
MLPANRSLCTPTRPRTSNLHTRIHVLCQQTQQGMCVINYRNKIFHTFDTLCTVTNDLVVHFPDHM